MRRNPFGREMLRAVSGIWEGCALKRNRSGQHPTNVDIPSLPDSARPVFAPGTTCLQAGCGATRSEAAVVRGSRAVYWLQAITLLWMLVECGLSLYAAAAAHSPALLAFGSDSFVELLSVVLVLLQFLPTFSISERNAGRAAGVLLLVLACVVSGVAIAALVLGYQPAISAVGIAVALAALIAMPVLAVLKRREARRTSNHALAADAVQSATCAYLAVIVLVGLLVNAIFHVGWFDSVAALAAVPLLLKEAKSAWRGHACGCC